MATSAQLLEEYKKKFNEAQAYDPNKFAKDLETAYNEKTNYNKDLIAQKNQLQEQQYSLPSQLRNDYYSSSIRNPLAQESIIAGRRANIGEQLGTTIDLLNARKQGFADILKTASGTYESGANKAATSAENTWRQYQDAVQQSQFAKQLANSGSGSAGIDMNAVVKAQQLQNLQTLSDELTRLKSARGSKNIEGQINSLHSQLLDWTKMHGIPMSSEDLWVAMGNTPAKGYKPSKSYTNLLKNLGLNG